MDSDRCAINGEPLAGGALSTRSLRPPSAQALLGANRSSQWGETTVRKGAMRDPLE
jgi:hypothetical protein